MSEQYREILNKHWFLLKSYINPTDCLINKLVSEKVLPMSMADDIRAGETQSMKNDRLLKSLKLVGSAAFKKFRHILLDHGHAFIAELLWDDEKDSTSFIEECDFNSYPTFKNSLNPMERKQLIWLLDSKIKSRLLQSEWKNNSEERIKNLRTKIHHDNSVAEELKITIIRLNAELSSKNESLKNLVKDYNQLNDDISSFEKRHYFNVKTIKTSSTGSGDNRSNNEGNSLDTIDESATKASRLKFMDNLIDDMDLRLSALLGDGEAKSFASIEDLNEKTKRLKQLIRELEAKVDKYTGEEMQVHDLLFPDEPNEADNSLIQDIQKYLSQEQNRRVTLLGDVDKLSKKLRGINDEESNSALKCLRQSAVTGNPPPEIVDFRFLRNHIALLMAEADHLNKKMSWKDEELSAMREECSNAQFGLGKTSCSKRVLKPIDFTKR